MARCLTRPPLTRSPMRTLTRSQPRSLLSIAMSNIARSRTRRSRSSQKRIAQTCCGLSVRFAPSFRPAFQGLRSLKPGSYSECPITFLPAGSFRPERMTRLELQREGLAVSGMTAFETGTAESCRSPGMDPADLFRPVSLVQIRPECANSGPAR